MQVLAFSIATLPKTDSSYPFFLQAHWSSRARRQMPIGERSNLWLSPPMALRLYLEGPAATKRSKSGVSGFMLNLALFCAKRAVFLWQIPTP